MFECIKELRLKLEEDLEECSNVFIVGHNGPDFDSIGSAIGLSVFAASKGKKAYIID